MTCGTICTMHGVECRALRTDPRNDIIEASTHSSRDDRNGQVREVVSRMCSAVVAQQQHPLHQQRWVLHNDDDDDGAAAGGGYDDDALFGPSTTDGIETSWDCVADLVHSQFCHTTLEPRAERGSGGGNHIMSGRNPRRALTQSHVISSAAVDFAPPSSEHVVDDTTAQHDPPAHNAVALAFNGGGDRDDISVQAPCIQGHLTADSTNGCRSTGRGLVLATAAACGMDVVTFKCKLEPDILPVAKAGTSRPKPAITEWRNGSIPFRLAFNLLTSSVEAAPCAGPRPRYLNDCNQPASTLIGKIYKESRPKKRQAGSDRWECKGGKRGCKRVLDSSQRFAIRRLYGRVHLRTQLKVTQDTRSRVHRYRYHQYSVQDTSKSSVDGKLCVIKLYHVVGVETRVRE